jgi:hypothetical protein
MNSVELFAEEMFSMMLPIQLPSDVAVTICSKMHALCDAIHENSVISHHQLFCTLYPDVADFYADFRLREGGDASSSVESLMPNYSKFQRTMNYGKCLQDKCKYSFYLWFQQQTIHDNIIFRSVHFTLLPLVSLTNLFVINIISPRPKI